MSLRTSYHFIAPFYDAFVDRITRPARQKNLAKLPQQSTVQVLLNGVGTGLDLPFLPRCHNYTALDLTPAMLARAQSTAKSLHLPVQWVQGNSMALPFAQDSFNYIVSHLIVAVVPQPALCLSESSRTLKPGGKIFLFDKFLRANEPARLRRALTPLISQFATRMDVVFEEILQATPDLQVVSDEAILAHGWFRLIELQKVAS